MHVGKTPTNHMNADKRKPREDSPDLCLVNNLEYDGFLLSAMPKINWKLLVCKLPTGFVEWFRILSLEMHRGNVLGKLGYKSRQDRAQRSVILYV